MSNTTSAKVSRQQPRHAQLLDLLKRAEPAMKAVLPKHMSVERMSKIAYGLVRRKTDLLACDLASFVMAVVQASELGLEVGGQLGEAYLVPFKDQILLIVGYRGLVKLARNSGHISTIEAHVVYSDDAFDLAYGLTPRLDHKPNLTASRSNDKIIAAYAIARFRDSGYQVEVMTIQEILAIRDRSASKKSGKESPWDSDFSEMAKKTVLRRLCKLLPLSPELAKALAHEAAIDAGEPSPLADGVVIDSDGVIHEQMPPLMSSESIAAEILGSEAA